MNFCQFIFLCFLPAFSCTYFGSSEESKLQKKFRSCLRKEGNKKQYAFVEPPNYLYGKPQRNINTQWNTRIPLMTPLAFFVPKSTLGVRIGVRCGVSTGIRVIPNSGGHSYEAISWGGNQTVVLDLREMKGVEIEGSGRNAVASIQAGALVAHAHAELWRKGKFGIPMGSCLTLGVGGHTLGGGFGFFSSMYGLTLDSLAEIEMVDAEGKVVTASGTVNPELFWALRGAGSGAFGIVTNFKFRPFQADKINLTLVSAKYDLKDFSQAYRGIEYWLDWTRTNFPEAAVTHAQISSDGISISSLFIQDPDRNPAESPVPFLAAFGITFAPVAVSTPASNPTYLQFIKLFGYAPIRDINNGTIGGRKGSYYDDPAPATLTTFGNRGPYYDDPASVPATSTPGGSRGSYYDDPAPAPALSDPAFQESSILKDLSILEKDMVLPRFFKAKSLFINRRLTNEELATLENHFLQPPPQGVGVILHSQFGAVQSVPWHSTSYSHRNSWYDMQATVEEPSNQDPAVTSGAMTWLTNFYSSLLNAGMDSGESYQNYPDFDLHEDFLKRFYGPNLERLIEAKRTWDKNDFFKNPVSIPTN